VETFGRGGVDNSVSTGLGSPPEATIDSSCNPYSSKYCLQRREITYRENPVNKWLFLLNKFLLEKTNLSLGSFLRRSVELSSADSQTDKSAP
jgi:hypothetical protein